MGKNNNSLTWGSQMIKLAILDNEVQMVEFICHFISSLDELADRVELCEFVSAEEVLKAFEQGERFDIILSDIELDSLQGIEFGKIIREKYPDVYLIFLTSHPEYAVQSYVLDAYQYILKSEMKSRLPDVIQKLVRILEDSEDKYIIVKTRFEAYKIYHRDIIYIKKVKGEKYSVFCTVHGEYAERTSLENIIKELNSDKFIMVERGYVVNYSHIICVKGNEIHLSNKERVEISRAKITVVKEKIFKCWEKMQ